MNKIDALIKRADSVRQSRKQETIHLAEDMITKALSKDETTVILVGNRYIEILSELKNAGYDVAESKTGLRNKVYVYLNKKVISEKS